MVEQNATDKDSDADCEDEFGTTQHYIREFVDIESQENVNFAFWWSYMEMISTLHMFTRAICDGQWDLYLYALSEMVPHIARYNHTNYLKSLTIFIAETNQLPAEVKAAFHRGDFVIKRSLQKFNQVDADHAQEWIVGTGKASGGILGITNETSALQRCALSYHWRTDITQKTRAMFGLYSSPVGHTELSAGHHKRHREDEEAVGIVTMCNVFSRDASPSTLQNVATKDLATEKIKNITS
ncbi:UNVERIFIED_CONTAM: hypothetical protein FKN15_053502 [Acipenser sinensis]